METQKKTTATVFNIQTYCIHDGPGIRTTVFLKGCPLRCVWCANPESQHTFPQLMTYRSKCTGCGSCIPICNRQAISLRIEGGSAYAVTAHGRCANCGACIASCPANARELAGHESTVDEVLETVLKDKLFMDGSGGGMTISGGEALAHPGFTAELLRKAQEAGLHTAVETCGYASKEVIDLVFPHVNLALYDFKHMDSEKHEEYTGVSNKLILDNARYIYHDLHIPMVARVPVIPGYNGSLDNIEAVAKFVADELGTDVPVHLLPYHQLGESKNESLGKELNFSITIPTDEYMQERKELVESYGFVVQIGG